MKPASPKIIIADDHILLLDLLSEIIESQIDNSMVHKVKNYRSLLASLESGDYDLVLMDYKMPGVNGMPGISNILSTHKNVRIAILSGFANNSEVTEFLNLGAAGFIPKILSPEVLICAVNLILSGETYVPNSVYEKGNHTSEFSITKRETEVLEKLHIGYSNKQIANALMLEEVTVKMYVSRLCKKLNSKNRTQLVVNAIDYGLLS